MAITAVTATTELRRLLRDIGDGGISAWWGDDDDEVYEGMLLDHVLSDSKDYVFTARGGGLFIYSYDHVFTRRSIWPATANPNEFIGEAEVAYRFYYRGLKIRVTGATPHAGGDIVVAGLLVDWTEAAARMVEYLACHRADEIAKSAAGGNVQNYADVAARLIKIAGRIRGPRGI